MSKHRIKPKADTRTVILRVLYIVMGVVVFGGAVAIIATVSYGPKPPACIERVDGSYWCIDNDGNQFTYGG